MTVRIGLGSSLGLGVRAGCPSFVPTSLGTDDIWLRADLDVSESGGLVSSWANQSNAAILASVDATLLKRPTLVASAINGHPALDLDGVANYLKGSGAARAQPRHVFAVCQPAAAAGVLWSNPAPNIVQMYLTAPASNERFSAYAGAGLTSTGAADWVAGTPMIVECKYNGASSEILRDGTSVISGNTGALGSDGLLLGVYLDEAQFFFDGYIAEYIEYSGILSAGDATQVRTYLGNRYSITV